MKRDYIEQNREDLEIMAKNIMMIEKRLNAGELSSEKARKEMERWFQGIPFNHLIEAFDFVDDYILKNLDK